MNNDQAPKFKSQWIIPIFVFVSVIILGLVFRNTLEDTLGIVVQYGLWVGDVFIKNFDQEYLWLQILVLSLALAGWFSGVFTAPIRKKGKKQLDQGAPTSGRIDYWLYRTYMYRSVRSGGIYFLLDFPNLIVETLAFHYRMDTETIKTKIMTGEIQVPAEVHSIVAMADESEIEIYQEENALGKLRNLFKRNPKQSRMSALESDARLEKVAAYLENMLEDENDR